VYGTTPLTISEDAVVPEVLPTGNGLQDAQPSRTDPSRRRRVIDRELWIEKRLGGRAASRRSTSRGAPPCGGDSPQPPPRLKVRSRATCAFEIPAGSFRTRVPHPLPKPSAASIGFVRSASTAESAVTRVRAGAARGGGEGGSSFSPSPLARRVHVQFSGCVRWRGGRGPPTLSVAAGLIVRHTR
jgi:hypothetical protein